MRRSQTLAIALAAAVLFIGAGAAAQKQTDKKDQTKQQPGQDPTLRADDVRLPVQVTKNDIFVSGLTKENFEVYEDGKLQPIKQFESPSDLPLRVAVLMDTSNSVKLKLPFEKDAAEDFMATVTTFRRKDKVLFATFDSDVELHQDFTDNLELLVRALRKVKAGGYTRLYDGVYRVIEEKMANLRGAEEPGAEARRVIVVLSDGEDTASERSLKEAVALAQRHDVTIFGISTKNFKGIGAGTVETSDDKKLRELCEETGGRIFLPSEKLELFRSFSKVKDGLRNEYVIFYNVPNPETTGKEREIKVKLKGASGDLYHKRRYIY
ncbi:MAG: VWA domain-containing protein [Blastocatellia bacterium]|nr:VWA domain-containing protein [Blastocatellia bacterium]